MAQPFPGNSSFPSLIDFEDDSNEDLSSFESWNSGLNPEHDYSSLSTDYNIMGKHKSSGFRGRFKGSDSRSSSSSSEFDPRDGSSRSGQNDGHVELRDLEEHHQTQNEEGTAVFQSPQSTLDLFLSSPHPNFRSPLPGIYDEPPSPYPSAASHVSPSLEKPPSRPSHGKPSNRINDIDAPQPYPSAASHVSLSMEKPPSRSDYGKLSSASSSCNRTYDNESPLSHPPVASHVSPSMEKPPSRSDHGKPSIASSSCNIIYDNNAPLPYSPAASLVSPSMEKPPSGSDHGKPSVVASSCDRIPEDEAINQGFPSISSQSESTDSPGSAPGGSNRFTDDGFSASEEEDPQEKSCEELGKIDDGAGDSGERFAAIYSGPGHRKSCSYGQQFDNDIMQGKRNAMRKHSLDERMPKHLNTCDEMYSVLGDRHEFKSQFLEKRSDEDSVLPEGLPEFIGNGGGNGIFKVPVRAAVHPSRPPALELRPHPLRETQTGRFLRTIVCTDSQLWAGQESGVRFWNLSDVFSESVEGSLPKGDEESAPFQESATASPTLCLLSDAANRLVWSGHKDGKIRSWKMDQTLDGSMFKEGLTWQAHRAPVLSIVMTSYGDLWSGSEGGAIRIWPWESMEKSLSLTTEERHMASLLVERSYIDLRNQVTVNGVCAIPASDVRYLLSDNCRAKVWSGGSFSFSLWDARTRELLKVFGSDGQAEIRVDMSSAQDPAVEDEMKVKFVTTSKKEKTQGSLSFFQRSRNALMGAADAVRRAASKGPFGDDSRRIDAIITSVDGMIWTGSANGLLVQWDGNGNRLQEFHHHSFSVQCLCSCGPRLWIGYASGTVQVMDLDGKLLGGWVAHSYSVIKMAVGGSYLFTLAAHGGIHAWNLISPGPIDNILRSELSKKELLYMKHETLKILTGTWNVGQERATQDSLISWLSSSASDVGIVVVGLQEVEMGAGFLAMSAAKETVGLEGSAIGQWWLDTIGKTLDEGNIFERVGSRQLAGLLIAVWVRKNLKPYVGNVDAAAVPCGFGRAIGNKGAVGLKMRVYSRIICFVNCHFAAHLEAVNRRNADFDHVYRTMVFSRPSNGANAVPGQLLRGVNAPGFHLDDGRPELSEADMIIFLGDFNYRLQGISYDEARDFVSQRSFDWLREKDQLRAEMKAGKVFQGMREGPIKFPPTYKFERHQAGLQGYDSSEKKRIPAWCDRILFRDSRTSASTEGCTLECPVVSSILHYDACMDVTDSDHKPVRCMFNVDIARVDERIRRREFGNIVTSNEKIESILHEYCNVPEIVVSTNNMILQNQDTSILRITNKCVKKKAAFEIICEGQSTIKDSGVASEHQLRGSFGFPRWLEVIPAAGIVKPGQIVEVLVHHEEFHTQEEFVDGIPQNWWCEDTRDKEVILVVNIRGNCMTEIKNHRIRVRHCFSSKSARIDSKGGGSGAKRVQSNHLHRSDFRSLGSSSDVVDDIRSLRIP